MTWFPIIALLQGKWMVKRFERDRQERGGEGGREGVIMAIR